MSERAQSSGVKTLIWFLLLALVAGGISLAYAGVLRSAADKYGGGQRGEDVARCVAQYTAPLKSETIAESACACIVTDLGQNRLTMDDLLVRGEARAKDAAEACIGMAE